jgi:type IV pilus assembly protein PilW
VPLVTTTDLTNNFGIGITGFEATGTGPGTTIPLPAKPVGGVAGDWTPALDGNITGATPAPGVPVRWSDVLVIYSSVPRVPPVYTTADAPAQTTNLTVSTPPPGAPAMTATQYAALSDCTKSMIFKVAGVAPNSVTLNNPTTLAFSTGALVAPLSTTVYYIGTGTDGDASLWRLEQVGGPTFTPEELVPDVENMQVLYGIDPAGTQTASAYVTADQVGGVNVVSIQVALLVASPPGSKPVTPPPAFNMIGTPVTVPADNRSRQVFYATMNLRNAVN